VSAQQSTTVDVLVTDLLLLHTGTVDEPDANIESGYRASCSCGQFMAIAPPHDLDGLRYVEREHAVHVSSSLCAAGVLRHVRATVYSARTQSDMGNPMEGGA
jgi:hypothetical protein